MKTITISLYNRPEYTYELFQRLNNCRGIEKYKVFICCEPTDPMVIGLAKNFRPEQTTVTVNQIRLGCNSNIFKSIATGFENSDYNIHFEDDTIPSKDCLEYFEWAKYEYQNDKTVFTVSGYVNSDNQTEHYNPRSTDVEEVRRRHWFTPWGWATWKDRWDEMKHEWDFVGKYGSWDSTVNRLLLQSNRYEIYPAIARVQNIGAERATHVPSPEWHRTHHFNWYWMESSPNLFTNKHNQYKEKKYV